MIVPGLIVLLIGAIVFIHYEGLRAISPLSSLLKFYRASMVIVVLGIIVVHTVEIAIYAVGYMAAEMMTGIGNFVGLHDSLISDTVLSTVPRVDLSLTFYDYFYFSTISIWWAI